MKQISQNIITHGLIALLRTAQINKTYIPMDSPIYGALKIQFAHLRVSLHTAANSKFNTDEIFFTRKEKNRGDQSNVPEPPTTQG